METFQKNVIIISTIVLIVCLFFVLLILKNSLETATWPPIKSICPDYWDVSLNNANEERCINNSTINTCKNNWPSDNTPNSPIGYCTGDVEGGDPGLNPDNFISLASGSQRPSDVECAKYKWAKSEGITWDGITNNKNICANSML